ncbi:MAG: hypothetical protein GEU80_08180 [Dehalococcoidia bacterium]|nr:hypothetical protein [Dehalococcoidia bacterium]
MGTHRSDRQKGAWAQTLQNVRVYWRGNLALATAFVALAGAVVTRVIPEDLGLLLLRVFALVALVVHRRRAGGARQQGYRVIAGREVILPSLLILVAIVVVVSFAFDFVGYYEE